MTTGDPAPDGRADPVIAEALAFAAARSHVYLLTRRADGFPTVYAMTGRVDAGCVLFSTYRASAKVKNLLREGFARVLVPDEDGTTDAYELGGSVRITDAERFLGPPAAPSQPAATPRERTVTPGIASTVRDRHESGKRIVLELRITEARFAGRPR